MLSSLTYHRVSTGEYLCLEQQKCGSTCCPILGQFRVQVGGSVDNEVPEMTFVSGAGVSGSWGFLVLETLH